MDDTSILTRLNLRITVKEHLQVDFIAFWLPVNHLHRIAAAEDSGNQFVTVGLRSHFLDVLLAFYVINFAYLHVSLG